jgi:hypothetical protein
MATDNALTFFGRDQYTDHTINDGITQTDNVCANHRQCRSNRHNSDHAEVLPETRQSHNIDTADIGLWLNGLADTMYPSRAFSPIKGQGRQRIKMEFEQADQNQPRWIAVTTNAGTRLNQFANALFHSHSTNKKITRS